MLRRMTLSSGNATRTFQQAGLALGSLNQSQPMTFFDSEDSADVLQQSFAMLILDQLGQIHPGVPAQGL